MQQSKQTSEDRVAYFLSALHLTLGRPELCAAFFNFLPSMAKDATDLFILGDFFNFWVGDDIQSPLTRQISDALAKLADQNIRIYFQHGNRDFAVGEHYARECHMEILPEIYSVPLFPKLFFCMVISYALMMLSTSVIDESFVIQL